MRPKISVAMATYNGGKYLREQLESLANQVMLPDELVICDDASTDSSQLIVENFALLCPFPVKVYLNSSNIGYAKNFERALLLTSGDIVFLCDQDDIWFRDKIRSIVSIFENAPNLLIAAHDCVFFSKDAVVSSTTLLNNQRRLSGGSHNQIHGCCTVIRRELMQIALPLPTADCGHYAHDDWLHTAGSFLNCRTIVEDVYLFYRRHESNVSRSDLYALSSPSSLNRYVYFLKKLRNFKRTPGEHLRHLEERLAAVSLLLLRVKSANSTIAWERCIFYVTTLENIQRGLRDRITMSSYKMLPRLGFATRMLCAGGYKPFSGWKSFFVDIIK